LRLAYLSDTRPRHFRDISDDPSEKELTQQDQFNNDEVALAEALVRETIQNSTDASANGGRVRVRFAVHTISTSSTSIIRQMVDGLVPSLKASELPLPQQRIRCAYWSSRISVLLA
jgi:hypothetical protein